MTVCPKCNTEFDENEPWNAGNCPMCGKKYHWDAITIQDGDYCDELPIIEWRTWDEIRRSSK